VTAGGPGDRLRAPVEALELDVHLDRLLAAAERRADAVPADTTLDPALLGAAARLRTDLVRFHPSFRFEERVAARLADLADRMRLPAAVGAEGDAVPGPLALRTPGFPELDAIAAGEYDPSAPEGQPVPRTVIIGGAMASAALSLAGVAYVAWRATRPSRPPGTPMARAVRAARAVRGDRARTRNAAAWRRAARVVRPS
jgi:hypothetical protein